MTTTTEATTATGVIQRVTETGILLVGEKGWYNRSRPEYDRTEGAAFPPMGSTVEISFTTTSTGKRYIHAFRDLGQRPLPSAEPAPAPGPREPRGSTYSDDRPVVTRLACLNSAIAFWSQIERQTANATEDDILGTAERFVAWATYRPEST